MRVIHAMGHAAAKQITEDVLKSSDNVYGYWSCLCEETKYGPSLRADSTGHCERCHQPVQQYKEMTFKNDDAMIVGSCDIAFMERREMVLTELKAISKTQFDKLEDAKPDHRMQLLMYAWLAMEGGYRVSRYGSVFYTRREWAPASPYKEFTVDLMAEIHRVEPLVAEARAIQRWKKEHDTLPGRICNSSTHPRAKQCALAAECFLRSGD
jgi:hypothetical protein